MICNQYIEGNFILELPHLYLNMKTAQAVNRLLYQDFNYLDEGEYFYISKKSLKEDLKNQNRWFFDRWDLTNGDRRITQSNRGVAITYKSDMKEVNNQLKNNRHVYLYRLSMKQLTRITFLSELTGNSLSYYINDLFLKNEIRLIKVYTRKHEYLRKRTHRCDQI